MFVFNSMFNGSELLIFIVGLIVIFASLAFSLIEGVFWQKQNPGKLGFKWGYFFIVNTLLGNGLFFAVLFFYNMRNGYGGGEMFIAALFLLTFLFCAIKALQRQRWALVLTTLLSFNILLFVVNFFYLRNRWPEFVAEKTEQLEAQGINLGDGGEASIGGEFVKIIQHLSNRWRQLQKNWRLATFGAGVWVLGVAVFVFFFQPYGGYMSDDEALDMLTIMFVPSVLALGLYWVYDKFVR